MKVIGNAAYIPLMPTNWAKRKFALVDLDDVERVLAVQWRAEAHGRTFYAKARSAKRLPQHHMWLHAFVAKALHGDRYDFINGDGLDCRKDNLRLASQSQDSKNRRKTDATWVTSRFKGVCLTVSGKWLAQVTADGQHYYCGVYDLEEDAARAYDEAARKYHGEFAKTNRELCLFEGQTAYVDPSTRHRGAINRPIERVLGAASAERLLEQKLRRRMDWIDDPYARPR